MGELYRDPNTNLITTGTSTSGEFIIYNNGNGGTNIFINEDQELQPVQYVISEDELAAFEIEAEPLNISFQGKQSYRFVPKKGSKRHLKEIQKKVATLGCVYFIKGQGDHKIGSSNATRIKRRVQGQCPDEILAISKPVTNFRAWEKRLHKKYQENRVLKYEIFRNLTEKQISDIIEEIGGVNIDL